MIATAATTISNGYWWEILAPGAAITIVVAAFAMLGDGLRDAFSADGQDAARTASEAVRPVTDQGEL
jgi:ABC-type dipeptide/oligopeptide/nickel transport system permease subunit